MIFLLRKKNCLLTTVVILLAVLNAKQTFAVTPEDLQWYQNEITNIQRNIEEQTKEDIKKGIRHKSSYDNLTDQDALKNKDQKKSKKNEVLILNSSPKSDTTPVKQANEYS